MSALSARALTPHWRYSLWSALEGRSLKLKFSVFYITYSCWDRSASIHLTPSLQITRQVITRQVQVSKL